MEVGVYGAGLFILNPQCHSPLLRLGGEMSSCSDAFEIDPWREMQRKFLILLSSSALKLFTHSQQKFKGSDGPQFLAGYRIVKLQAHIAPSRMISLYR